MLAMVTGPATLAAQSPAAAPPAGTRAGGAEGIVPPADYLIGPADRLQIVFWRDEDMTREVVVRPDGKISMPLLNDVQAAGLTPVQLGEQITKAATQFMDPPNVQVIVLEINSRQVYITGMVAAPKHYPLVGPTSVLQLIAMAGGLLEYAKTKDIRIIRTENGRQVAYRFNYNDVRQGRNLQQNIELKPGDTVIVP